MKHENLKLQLLTVLDRSTEVPNIYVQSGSNAQLHILELSFSSSDIARYDGSRCAPSQGVKRTPLDGF